MIKYTKHQYLADIATNEAAIIAIQDELNGYNIRVEAGEKITGDDMPIRELMEWLKIPDTLAHMLLIVSEVNRECVALEFMSLSRYRQWYW